MAKPAPSVTSPTIAPLATDGGGGATMTCPSLLEEARAGGTTPGIYVVPTEEARTSVGAAMTSLLAGKKPDVASLGFEVLDAPDISGAFVLRESPSKKRGGGAYLVRGSSSSKLVVQAPHTFFDEGTFPLACELFQRSSARALFINTVHRYKGAPKDASGEHPSDVAHAATSLFQAATEALAKSIPGLTVVQVHGFATRVTQARAVVSSGERKRDVPLVAKVASALEKVVGGKVQRFPDDTSELGATTNVQGPVVRRAGGRFIHIELEDALRKELLADAVLRARALDAIAGALADAP
jgi:hypothetical protein